MTMTEEEILALPVESLRRVTVRREDFEYKGEVALNCGGEWNECWHVYRHKPTGVMFRAYVDSVRPFSHVRAQAAN